MKGYHQQKELGIKQNKYQNSCDVPTALENKRVSPFFFFQLFCRNLLPDTTFYIEDEMR